jgi:hypothetical protein
MTSFARATSHRCFDLSTSSTCSTRWGSI